MEREIPLFTLAGVQDADITTHYCSTEDGLGLSLLRFTRPGARESVMLIHGLTTSTDMFIMPEHRNIVTVLLDAGYDVWSFDFRMSNRHSYNMYYFRYTLDDVALYDYKPAVDLVRAEIGDQPLHIICHCLGAASFTMSLFAGIVDGFTSVIANSVALTPRIPLWSHLKLSVSPRLVELAGFQYLNPKWSEDPWLTPGKLFSKLVDLFHPECDVPACHMLSLMWGTGWPALYSHANLADVTHRRGGDLYGPTSMNYYRHVIKMVRAHNTAIKYNDAPQYAALPDDYFERAHEVTTPVLFMTGEHNHVFTDSNVECHRRLHAMGCTQHELKVFPGYGHQDPFMGKNVAEDIFPDLIDFMQRKSAEALAATA
jgi:lysosomal acid lipase/cholesteryl ester hydrolase